MGPYESPYSIAHKFQWANVYKFWEVCSLFGKYSKYKYWLSKTDMTFLDSKWLPSERASDEYFGPHLPSMSDLRSRFLDSYAGDWATILADKYLRFCPLCLNHGYHSIFFQLKFLTLCPIHRVPLTSECPRCKSESTSFSLNEASFRIPVACGRCGLHWGTSDEQRFQWFDTERFHQDCKDAFRPFEVWLNALRQNAIPNGINDEFPPALKYLNSEASDLAYIFAERLTPHQIDMALIRKIPPLRFVEIAVPHDQPDVEGLDDERLVQTIRTYKSIRRNISKNFLIGYRAWISNPRWCDILSQIDDPTDNCVQPYVVQAYLHWRSTFESDIFLKDKKESDYFFNSAFENSLDCEDARNPSLLAHALISYFYGICAVILDLKNNRQSEVLRHIQIDSNDGDSNRNYFKLKLSIFSYYKIVARPYLSLEIGNRSNHYFFSPMQTLNKEAPNKIPIPGLLMLAHSGPARQLLYHDDAVGRRLPGDMDLAQLAVEAGLVPSGIFSHRIQPFFSTKRRRKLRRMLLSARSSKFFSISKRGH